MKWKKKNLDHFWSFRHERKSGRPFWFHLLACDWSARNLIRDFGCFSTAALTLIPPHIHHSTPSYWDIGCRVFIARVCCNKNWQCARLISCGGSLAPVIVGALKWQKKGLFFVVFFKLQTGRAVGRRWRVDESSEKWREATKAGIFEKHQSFNGAFSDKNGRSLSPARAAITSPGSFEG